MPQRQKAYHHPADFKKIINGIPFFPILVHLETGDVLEGYTIETTSPLPLSLLSSLSLLIFCSCCGLWRVIGVSRCGSSGSWSQLEEPLTVTMVIDRDWHQGMLFDQVSTNSCLMELLIGKHAGVCVPTALVEAVRLAEYTCINTERQNTEK